MFLKKEFNSKLETKKAYISLFSITICQLISVIPVLWFDFGVFLTTIFLSFIELYIFITDSNNLLNIEGFIFKCDKAILTQQINTYKSIYRLWAFALTFLCLNNLLLFISTCIFAEHYFEIRQFITDQMYDNSQDSILFDLLYFFDLNTIHSNLREYNFITMLMFFIRGLFTFYLIKEYKNIDKKMSHNESIQKILAGNKRLNKDLICDLIDKNDKNHKIQFQNGCFVQFSTNNNLLDTKIILLNNNQIIKTYCYSDYFESYSMIFQSWNKVIQDIIKDINNELQLHDTKNLLHEVPN